MRKTIAARAGALLLLAAAALPARAQGQIWRHGLLEAKADAGFMMMVSQGFAEQRGLKLEMIQFKNDVAPLQALIAGQLDSFEGGPQGTIIATGRGADLKIIGCHYPGLPHGLFVRGAIETPADLRGKTIAISAPGAFPDVLARALLAKYDVPAAEVAFANLGSDGDRFKALAAKVVDAAVISNEYTPIAKQQDVRMLLAGRDILPDYVRTCIMSTSKTLAARHDAAVRFLAAEMSAIRHALTHRDETVALAHKMTAAKPDDPRAAFIYDDAIRTHAVDPDVGLPVEKLLWLQQLLVKQGALPGPYDIAKVVDPAVNQAALTLAGK